MAAVTAKMVKDLREMTGAGMMDCKKALSATDGDMDKAVEFLREKGLAGAEKKAGRIAADGIVDTAAAKLTFCGHFLYIFFLFTEKIEGERTFHGIDPGDCFIQCAVSDDWQERSEDLFLHDSIFKGHVVKKGRSDLESIRIDISAKDYFFRIEQSSDAFKMFLVYDLSVGRIFQRLTAELFRDLTFQFADQSLFSFFITVNIIRGNSGLSAV